MPDLHVKSLKTVSDLIALLICQQINFSLDKCVCPFDWKIACSNIHSITLQTI